MQLAANMGTSGAIRGPAALENPTAYRQNNWKKTVAFNEIFDRL